MAMRTTLVFYLFAVLVLAYIAAGVNAATCRTNAGSPTVGDANCVTNYIRNLGGNCCQLKCSGDFCTEEHVCGTARARMCGNCDNCVPCSVEVNALQSIINECSNGGRVAGSEFSDGYEWQIGAPASIEEASIASS